MQTILFVLFVLLAWLLAGLVLGLIVGPMLKKHCDRNYPKVEEANNVD